MKMFDVLSKLKEIEGVSPEVSEAIKNVEAMAASTKAVRESVNITVSGNDAVLSQILKLAGMIGAETTEAVEELDNRPFANSPEEMVSDLDSAIPSGDDLHAEKGTYPTVAGGDNPMQTTEREIFSVEQIIPEQDNVSFLKHLAGLK
jgi:hypothetical protein